MSEHARCGCGGAPRCFPIEGWDEWGMLRTEWRIRCDGCPVGVTGVKTEAEAWAAWDLALGQPYESQEKTNE